MKNWTNMVLLCVGMAAFLQAKADDSLIETKYSVKPSLLSSTASGDVVPALGYDVEARYDCDPWTGKVSGFAKAWSQGTIATRGAANAEALFAELQIGAAWQMTEDSIVPPPPGPGEQATLQLPTGGRRFGRLELCGKVRFETDQLFENNDVAYGPQIGYFHSNATGMWPLMPSLYVDYLRVNPCMSDYLEDIGADDGGFYRASAVASWDVPIGEILAPKDSLISPLGMIFNARYYSAYDVPSEVKTRGRDESWYGECGIRYEFTDRGMRWLRSVFLTVARGRTPPVTDNATMVFLGIVLGPDKNKIAP